MQPLLCNCPILKAVLANKSIIKTGVSIDQDMLALCREWGSFEAHNRVDLSRLVLSTEPFVSECGLKRLTQHILGLDLPKPKKTSCSDWSLLPLSYKQVAYAARDAWVSAAVAETVFDQWQVSLSDVAESVQAEEESIKNLLILSETIRSAKSIKTEIKSVCATRRLSIDEVQMLRDLSYFIDKCKRLRKKPTPWLVSPAMQTRAVGWSASA
jgi:3'-5' exonuclease